MPLQLRAARPEDYQVVAKITGASAGGVHSPEQLTELCDGAVDAPQCLLVAERQAAVVGLVIYFRVLDEMTIVDLAVARKLRGQGLGAQLLAALLAAMAAQGVARCLLEVRASNLPARALYSQYGFSIDGVRRNYYPMGRGREDALLMSVDLDERNEEAI